MKIKVVEKSFDDVMALPRPAHKHPARQSLFFRILLKLLSRGDIRATNVKYSETGMDKLQKTPCLYLMNHSSFLDLKIAFDYLFPKRFSIICTSDGFIGKFSVMRALGCVPTLKFVTSPSLVKDIDYTLKKLKQNVLMYPEASYTFDGTPTPLPEGTGRLIKMLGVPVVTVITHGAFARDPLYNGLQLRRVNVDAEIKCLLTPEQIANSTAEQINETLKKEFSFDNFRWQKENKVCIDEPFRADGLNRVLYKCPHCLCEGKMDGRGVNLTCGACGKSYYMDEYGALTATQGDTEFSHIPDWFAWEREQVRHEIENGTYKLEADVDIRMMVDYKAIYSVGSGKLVHDVNGFHLTGCEGKLDYTQSPAASYGLYADYFWYELGDMVCLGDSRALYYCFPKNVGDVVAKTRIATEEIYKLYKQNKKKNNR